MNTCELKQHRLGYQPERCKHSNVKIGDKWRVKLDKNIHIVDKARPLKIRSARYLAIGSDGWVNSWYQVANGQWANEYVCLAANIGTQKQVDCNAVANDLNEENNVKDEPCSKSNYITLVGQCLLDIMAVPGLVDWPACSVQTLQREGRIIGQVLWIRFALELKAESYGIGLDPRSGTLF